MNILDDLKARTIFKDITNLDKFSQLTPGAGVYIGFDPSADSLHLGNYIQIAILKRFKNYGFNAVAVVGGATGMIGDPSGKSEERNLLSKEQLVANKNKIKKQLTGFGLKVVDNFDFYKDLNVLDFLRDYGKLININYMIGKDIVANRLESGISFTEFSYQLIQAVDFYKLYQDHGVKVQLGGSDQWGNITAGVELIRKIVGDKNLATGITTQLLLTASGKKFGKSEGNPIWIDQSKTSPFALFQYLYNIPDKDVAMILKWLTFIPVEEIDEILATHQQEPKQRYAQEKLALAVTTDIHGEDFAKSAQKISAVLFEDGEFNSLSPSEFNSLSSALPSITTSANDLQDVLVEAQVATSKRQAREFIEAGSIKINDQKITDINHQLSKKSHLIKRGKRNYFFVTIT